MQAKAKEAPPTTRVKESVAGSFDENIKATFSKRIKEEPSGSKPGEVQKLEPGQVTDVFLRLFGISVI